MNGVSCNDVLDRLLEGARPAEDHALAEHVGSCLGCFRVAGELRDLPRIATVLQAEVGADPGHLFWEGFSARVADAWRGEQAGAQVARRGVEDRPSSWERFVSWFNRPLPAAFAGAAVAGALVFATVRPMERLPANQEAIEERMTSDAARPVVASALTGPRGEAADEPLGAGDPDEVTLYTEGRAAPLEELEELDTATLTLLAKNLEPL